MKGSALEDICPTQQNGKAEIKASKCPCPSSPKVWKYFPEDKCEFLILQELGWLVMVMRNPEARQRPIMGEVSFQINFKEYHAI